MSEWEWQVGKCAIMIYFIAAMTFFNLIFFFLAKVKLSHKEVLILRFSIFTRHTEFHTFLTIDFRFSIVTQDIYVVLVVPDQCYK